MAMTPRGASSQGIKAISGVTIHTMTTGTLSSPTPLPGKIGDILISQATGKMYIAEPSLAHQATGNW